MLVLSYIKSKRAFIQYWMRRSGKSQDQFRMLFSTYSMVVGNGVGYPRPPPSPPPRCEISLTVILSTKYCSLEFRQKHYVIIFAIPDTLPLYGFDRNQIVKPKHPFVRWIWLFLDSSINSNSLDILEHLFLPLVLRHKSNVLTGAYRSISFRCEFFCFNV